MGLDDLPGDDLVGADAAVVGPLGPGEAVRGPAEGPAVDVQEGVLLLDAEPGLLLLHEARVHGLLALEPFVRGRRRVVEVEGLAEHEDVVVATEGVLVDRYRLQEDLTVLPVGLVRRAAVVGPEWQVCKPDNRIWYR